MWAWERGSKGVWAVPERHKGVQKYSTTWRTPKVWASVVQCGFWAMNHTGTRMLANRSTLPSYHTDSYCTINWNQNKLKFVVGSVGLPFASKFPTVKTGHCQFSYLAPHSKLHQILLSNTAFHLKETDGITWYFTGDLWRRSSVTQFRGNFSSAEVKQLQEKLVMSGGGTVGFKCLHFFAWSMCDRVPRICIYIYIYTRIYTYTYICIIMYICNDMHHIHLILFLYLVLQKSDCLISCGSLQFCWTYRSTQVGQFWGDQLSPRSKVGISHEFIGRFTGTVR